MIFEQQHLDIALLGILKQVGIFHQRAFQLSCIVLNSFGMGNLLAVVTVTPSVVRHFI